MQCQKSILSVWLRPMTKILSKHLMDKLRWEFFFLKDFWLIGTGKSFSEALILASTNPQYDKRLFMELPWKLQAQNMGRTCSAHALHLVIECPLSVLSTANKYTERDVKKVPKISGDFHVHLCSCATALLYAMFYSKRNIPLINHYVQNQANSRLRNFCFLHALLNFHLKFVENK